jgi:integrase
MLTEKTVAAAKPNADKAYRLWDEGGGGLYLDVMTSGRKVWRMQCRVAGKDVLLTFGRYDPNAATHVSLKQARERRDKAQRDIRDGKDPREEDRKREAAIVATLNPADANRLRTVALAYLDVRNGQDPKSKHQDQRRLEMYIFPYKVARLGDRIMGDTDIRELEDGDLLAALRAIEAKGLQPLAHKIKTLCSGIWKHAKHSRKCATNIVADLAGTIKRGDDNHYASIQEPPRIGKLLLDIDGYWGQPETVYCLRLQPFWFLRSHTLRHIEWTWVDWDNTLIRIPPGAMKRKHWHVVPLARQAIVLLRELQELTGGRSKYLFPSLRTTGRPISDGTLNGALRRLGYSKADQTTHGFRAIADTHLHEMGYADGWIDVQMSHLKKSKTKRAYDYAQYLADPNTDRRPRHEMMQAWADYLDKLREKARRTHSNTNNVIPMTAA